MADRPWAWGKGVGLAGLFGVASRFCDGQPSPQGSVASVVAFWGDGVLGSD